MKLENRLPDEGINASSENPLREFVWLLAGTVGAIVVLVAIVAVAADWIAPRIPYRYEAKLVQRFPVVPAREGEAAEAIRGELQALADRLAARMQLPEGLQVRVAYSDSEMVNAFATLGGRTMFFRGMLARLASEDALAMVMAHEIAHLKLRHPAQALGRGVAIGIVLSVVSSELGRSAAGSAVNQAGVITLLSFNRDQERAADAAALAVIAAEYGHVGGAIDLFGLFEAAQLEKNVPGGPSVEFLRTHPLTQNRIAEASAWAQKHGVAVDGPRKPLSPILRAVREAKAGG